MVVRRLYHGGALLLWSFLIGVGPAGASIMTPGLFAFADANAISAGPTCPCDSLASQGVLSFTTGIPAAGAGAVIVGADSSYSANAKFGVLHASADATASTISLGTEAFGEAEAGWLDIFTVVSKTLPAGSPVDFRGTAVLDGSVSSAASHGAMQRSSAEGTFKLTLGSVVNSFGCPDAISPCGSNDLLVSPSAMSVNDKFTGVKLPATTTFDITTSVGAQFFLEGLLGVNAAAFTAGTAHADFSDTGFVTLVSVTPGASFTTASGTTYSPSSPPASEPSTIWLVSTGVAVFVLLRRSVGVAMGRA